MKSKRIYRPKHGTLRTVRGYPSSHCDYVVEEYDKHSNDWDTIAEFWNRTDAYLFVRARKGIKKGYEFIDFDIKSYLKKGIGKRNEQA